MGKNIALPGHVLIYYEHRKRIFFSTKASRTFTGVYDVARRFERALDQSWLLVWSAVVVEEEQPGWVEEAGWNHRVWLCT